jgi:hypothetical protein
LLNEPLTDTRIPEQSDGPLGGIQIANAVLDLAPHTIPDFNTTGARDSAFSAWVTAGNAMRDGLHCSVDGATMEYRDGAWRGMGSRAYRQITANTSTHLVTADVMTLTIPDPGYPYRVVVSGSVLLSTLGANVTVAAQLRVNGTNVPPRGANVGPFGSDVSNVLVAPPQPGTTDTLTGGTTAELRVQKLSGPSGSGFVAASSSVYHMLSAQVFPV